MDERILDYLEEAGIEVYNSGQLGSELDRNLFLAHPDVQVLSHERRAGAHPEAPLGTWAGVLAIEAVGSWKVIVDEVGPRVGYLYVAPGWSGDWSTALPDQLREASRVAERIENGQERGCVPGTILEDLRALWRAHEDWRDSCSSELTDLGGVYNEKRLKEAQQRRDLGARVDVLSERISLAFDSAE